MPQGCRAHQGARSLPSLVGTIHVLRTQARLDYFAQLVLAVGLEHGSPPRQPTAAKGCILVNDLPLTTTASKQGASRSDNWVG